MPNSKTRHVEDINEKPVKQKEMYLEKENVKMRVHLASPCDRSEHNGAATNEHDGGTCEGVLRAGDYLEVWIKVQLLSNLSNFIINYHGFEHKL